MGEGWCASLPSRIEMTASCLGYLKSLNSITAFDRVADSYLQVSIATAASDQCEPSHIWFWEPFSLSDVGTAAVSVELLRKRWRLVSLHMSVNRSCGLQAMPAIPPVQKNQTLHFLKKNHFVEDYFVAFANHHKAWARKYLFANIPFLARVPMCHSSGVKCRREKERRKTWALTFVFKPKPFKKFNAKPILSLKAWIQEPNKARKESARNIVCVLRGGKSIAS